MITENSTHRQNTEYAIRSQALNNQTRSDVVIVEYSKHKQVIKDKIRSQTSSSLTRT